MIPLGTICAILLTHWVADFVLQTDWQANNKSKSNIALFEHVVVYTLAWFPFVLFFLPIDAHVPFLVITFFTHFATDWITSRNNSRLWAKGDVHNFFVSVGADQVIHYSTLIGTYLLLMH